MTVENGSTALVQLCLVNRARTILIIRAKNLTRARRVVLPQHLRGIFSGLLGVLLSELLAREAADHTNVSAHQPLQTYQEFLPPVESFEFLVCPVPKPPERRIKKCIYAIENRFAKTSVCWDTPWGEADSRELRCRPRRA